MKHCGTLQAGKNMKKLIFIFLFPFNLIAQCDNLVKQQIIPIQHSLMEQLEPDPCNALSDYGTRRILTHSPSNGLIEKKFKVKINQEISWDPDNCQAQTKELSRDTILIEEKVTAQQPGKITKPIFTVRMELLQKPPQSRPSGTKCTKLMEGNLSGYWIVHYGEYSNMEEARQATIQLKQRWPEFCRAFPTAISSSEFRYEFK